MTALDAVAVVNPLEVYDLLPGVMKAAEGGSVIARDHAVGILTKLARDQKYARKAMPLLLNQLKTCPDNQFPMYSEMSMCIVNQENKGDFVKIFRGRLGKLKKESQKARIEKLLRKV